MVKPGRRFLLVNGVAQSITANGSDTTHTISGSGLLTSVGGQTRTAAGSGDMGIKSITVDGVALVDPVTTNGNTVATTFNPFTTDIDAVRGQETGYCTWNPLAKGNINLSNGNLTAIPGANDQSCFATYSIPDNGKVYFEFTCIQRGGGGAQSPIWGVGDPSGVSLTVNPQNSGNNASTWLYGGDGNKTGGGSGSTSYGTAFVAGDVIGVCVDRSNSRIWFSKNNVWQNGGNPNDSNDSNAAFTNVTSTGTLIPFYGNNNGTYGYGSVNFGQKPFKYAPPDGFQSLNAANVRPETVITRPDQYVSTTLYTGDGGASKSISGLNFGGNPDLVWVKGRSYSISHLLYDSVRGAGSTKSLVPNGTNTEGSAGDNATFGYVSSLDNNGFSLVGGSDVNNGYVNKNTATYVGWCWRAGGNKNTFNKDDVGYASAAAAGLTGGSITPTGSSVGTRQGFSIVKATLGTASGNVTIPHGLEKTPDFIIAKSLTNTYNWDIYHKDATPGGANRLIFTSSGIDSQDPWGSVAPTSSVFTFSAGFYNNASSNVIYYSWHDVPGLQKFGKYTGGSNAFVELGFRPAIVIFKSTGSENWNIFDTKRTPFNSMTKSIQPNLPGAEYTSEPGMDFLSNGFKCRGSVNTSATYVYMAWAEAPTVNLYGGESNAR